MSNAIERYFELGPVAVYSCDAAGVIQEFNRRAVELWGCEPAPGDTDKRFCGSFKLFRPDGTYMPHDECPMAEVVAGTLSEAADAEVLIERPDGSRITVIVNIRPLKDQGGDVTGAINCFYDITSRKQTEDALRRSLEDVMLTFTPDLVFSDIAMPGRDGYAVLSGVRQVEALLGRHVPVAAASAYGYAEDRQRASAAGFDQYLATPVDPEALATTVNALVALWESSPRRAAVIAGGRPLYANVLNDSGASELEPHADFDLTRIQGAGGSTKIRRGHHPGRTANVRPVERIRRIGKDVQVPSCAIASSVRVCRWTEEKRL